MLFRSDFIYGIDKSEIDVELQLCDSNGTNERELITNLIPIRPDIKSIRLKDVIEKLQAKGYILTEASFSYYSTELESFKFCGFDPIPSNVLIPLNEIPNGILILYAKLNESTSIIPCIPSLNGSETNTRTRKRTIKDIIDKVIYWRTLHTGCLNSSGKFYKMSLTEAQKYIDIPKKSLDDYYNLIRFGWKHSFDFDKHKNDTIGVLRAYVKCIKSTKNV